MIILRQWIVDEHKLLVLLADGTYKIGDTSNIYGFRKISKKEAEILIKNG